MDLDSYPSNFLAFRSSCDRCRYMKLKCPSNGTESHEPCERCLKAKLPCKYSRRTNSSRRSATRPDSTLDASEAQGRISVPEALVQNQLTTQSDRSPTSDSALIPEVQPETPGAFCFSDALNSVAMELPWMDWDVPSTDSTVPLWSTQSPPLSEPRKTFSAQGILNLASLAVELGECLQLLNRDVRAQSIDEYPIGHIRHLSQAFVVSSQKGLTPSLDVSATLLLLSCYVSLRKLFINAFGNIRDNLPMDNEMQAQLPHRQDYRNMSLRGMDALSQRCLRSYTAFNMTLEFMNNCNAAIHLCTVCRPQGQSPQLKLLASLQCVRTVDDADATLEEPPSVCIACGLPASVKQEAASILHAIADQECSLHEVTSMLRGTLGQRIGLL